MQFENTYLGNKKSVESNSPIITVGIDEGMFRGNDHFTIQAAVDYAARQGGGTVHISSGKYFLRNAIFLPSFVTLEGEGDATILEKSTFASTPMTQDTDWYSWSVVVEDASSFAAGDGIMITSERTDGGSILQIAMHTISEIKGNRIFLDRITRLNHWTPHHPKVTSLHSLIDIQNAHNVAIRDICLVGNRANNDKLNGNHGAAIFMQECENIDISDVVIKDFNGDAISWQIGHDVHVENCVIDNVAALGLHPGSGSQRPIMQHNKISDCQYGIFWCWGVCYGIAEENEISGCEFGISTGHRDNDNIIRCNRITNSSKFGIHFRPERSAEHTSNRILIEANIIEGAEGTTGIAVAHGCEDIRIRNNTINVFNEENAIIVDTTSIRTSLENNVIN